VHTSSRPDHTATVPCLSRWCGAENPVSLCELHGVVDEAPSRSRRSGRMAARRVTVGVGLLPSGCDYADLCLPPVAPPTSGCAHRSPSTSSSPSSPPDRSNRKTLLRCELAARSSTPATTQASDILAVSVGRAEPSSSVSPEDHFVDQSPRHRRSCRSTGGERSSRSWAVSRVRAATPDGLLLAYWWVLLSSASGSAVTSIAGIAVPVGGRWPGSGEA
jgi:hypothetical protein